MGTKKPKKSTSVVAEVANKANEVAQKLVQRLTEEVPADLSALQAAWRKEKEEKEILQKQLAEAQTEIAAHNAEIEEVAERAVQKLEELTAKVSKLEREKVAKEQELAAQVQQRAAQASQIQTLENQLASEQQTSRTLNASLGSLTVKMEQLRNSLDVSEARCGRLETELSRAKSESLFEIIGRVKRRMFGAFV